MDNNFDNEVFEFGTNPNEEANNFNYENISGLGESNYENEDLFNNLPPMENNNPEPVASSNNSWDINNFSYDLASDNNLNNNMFDVPNETQQPEAPVFNVPVDVPQTNNESSTDETLDSFIQEKTEENNEQPDVPAFDMFEAPSTEIPTFETPQVETPAFNTIETQPVENVPVENVPVENVPVMENIPEQVVETNPVDNIFGTPIPEVAQTEDLTQTDAGLEDYVMDAPKPENAFEDNMATMPTITTEYVEPVVEAPKEEVVEEPQEEKVVEMSDVPIDELQKLTEYEDDKIESTDINSLFDKLSVNVKDASEIFRKNTSLKEKIDSRFDELKKLQGELTNSRKKQTEEIDRYRDEVLYKLTEKKEEIEKRLNTLKELQATLEKEKSDFEEYKRKEEANISKVQKQVQAAYDERREELEHIEDVLRKQKDALDEERNQLSLDKIQYEADKNDLANNLLKFNQIVSSFTNGIEVKNEE